jgi:hypothetical protein
MTAKSTSFRLSEEARARLAEQAAREGISATALLERLILEGVDALEHPGIVFRGPPHDRRAALAAGPDDWDVVARLRALDGATLDAGRARTYLESYFRSARVSLYWGSTEHFVKELMFSF